MGLSVIVGGTVAMARKSEAAQAFAFGRGEAEPGTRQASDSTSSVLIVRRDGGDDRHGEIFGFLATTQWSAEKTGNRRGDVFLLDGLRLHPDLAGFSPGAHRLLISVAVVRLAWTEADNDETAAFVVIRVRASDLRVREDLRMLRARRMDTGQVASHGLVQMSPGLPTTEPVEFWEVTPEMARQCAKLVQMEAHSDDPWRISRASAVEQRLRLRLDMRWLRVGHSLVEALTDGSAMVNWGALPENVPESRDDRAVERERPDGDKSGS